MPQELYPKVFCWDFRAQKLDIGVSKANLVSKRSTLSTLYFANINFREHKFSRTLIFANFAIGKIWTFREHLISRSAIFGNFANIYFREFWKCWRIYQQLMINFSKKILTRPVFWVSFFPFFRSDRFLKWLENIQTKLFYNFIKKSYINFREH